MIYNYYILVVLVIKQFYKKYYLLKTYLLPLIIPMHFFRVRKGFKCHCGKSYKTNSGLKNHTTVMHSGATMTTITTQTGEVLQVRGLYICLWLLLVLAISGWKAVHHVSTMGGNMFIYTNQVGKTSACHKV